MGDKVFVVVAIIESHLHADLAVRDRSLCASNELLRDVRVAVENPEALRETAQVTRRQTEPTCASRRVAGRISAEAIEDNGVQYRHGCCGRAGHLPCKERLTCFLGNKLDCVRTIRKRN